MVRRLISVAALVLAACLGGAQAGADTIKIGYPYPRSGAVAPTGDADLFDRIGTEGGNRDKTSEILAHESKSHAGESDTALLGIPAETNLCGIPSAGSHIATAASDGARLVNGEQHALARTGITPVAASDVSRPALSETKRPES